MSFHQKIYYNNKPFILAGPQADLSRYQAYKKLEGATAGHFKEALSLLEDSACSGVLLVDADRAQLEKELLWNFYPVYSGGGVVVNENGAILMILRRGKWDLPKGKLDEGEDIEQCALREVREETGLEQVTLGERIGNTMHIYSMNNQLMLKYTEWYLMRASVKSSLLPQEEEKIEEVRWVRPADIPVLLRNSYETITDVLKEANIL
ncbi:MAG: NUDIX hydrolase [Chitinophagaceae bacterium]|nr:NUDIX hydrolase [Chitinophagaceae bacterium]